MYTNELTLLFSRGRFFSRAVVLQGPFTVRNSCAGTLPDRHLFRFTLDRDMSSSAPCRRQLSALSVLAVILEDVQLFLPYQAR